jgi:hypothetical protein
MAAIMKSKSAASSPSPIASVSDLSAGGSLKLSGWKRVRFDDIVSAAAVAAAVAVPPPLHAVKKPWKQNRFVSDWNASSSDDDSDCD